MLLSEKNWWNAEQDALAMSLAVQGYSCRQIGEIVGVPKNAVVGRLFRLRQKGKFKPSLKKEKTSAVVGKKRRVIAHRNGKVVVAKFAATPLPPIDRTDEPPSKQVSLLDIENGQCRYPHGEGAQVRFCGHPVVKGAYCAFHAKICYVTEEGK